MAFLQRTDIASSLPIGFETALVDRLLVRLGVELKGLGLVWDVPTSTTRPVKGEQNSHNSLLDFNYVKTITAVNLKYEGGSSSSSIISSSQYNLVEHPNLTDYFYRIEFNNWILHPIQYVEITGLWGCFIDFTVLDEKASLLKGIIIDYVLKQLRYSSQNFQTISRAKTGDTDIEFSQLSNSNYSSSITQDSEFRSALNYFRSL